ncbi:MAG TPA: cytochrome-c peroxidase, partial [Gammaproteobacteria bacterium]|nr:cytochrome-c peroxidase [Gammaproteobacteria bacterium]
MSASRRIAVAAFACLAAGSVRALPPVPVPAENPVTEPKRVLGKILFWDEQLSADDTIACGTCHRPAQGGSDPRVGRNPGADAGTIDDVEGSPGIVRLDAAGRPAEHPVFGRGPQVTARVAPSNFGALWAERVFWDGRAGPGVVDPDTHAVAIERGGALEAQALATLATPAEMTHESPDWHELVAKLERARPLAL